MKDSNEKFNKLTPEILKENKKIYTKALNYAFNENDIKNIAITGIYGAGKTSVWRTYIKEKNLKNIITVSLGKYEDIKNKDESLSNEIDNRIEKQLINQILSQVNHNKIPLCKYKFKKNNTYFKNFLKAFLTILFLSGILIWFSIKDLTKLLVDNIKYYLMFYIFISLFIPLLYFFYNFYKENRFILSKVNVKGAEVNFKDDNENDETILDRDMRELVYILNSSKTEVIVFEDLDRYDNIHIFTKLRELNFLLNEYKANNNSTKIVKFIYMVKDELFCSKNRTKFFDFIIPIVPIIDSKNSENKLLELLKNILNSPDKDVLTKISLYVDDMRLLKNIVNEYIIYSKIISIDELELDKNKLFSIIVVKNIFPDEFDKLQKNEGYIYKIFNNLEDYRKSVKDLLKEKLKQIEERIIFLNDRIETNKFEAMALMLPSDIRNKLSNKTWAETLKEWSKNEDESKFIEYNAYLSNINYNKFLESFIKDTENKEILEKITEDKNNELNRLALEKIEINTKLRNYNLQSVKELLLDMPYSERETAFNTIDNIENKNYLPLIKVLILEGLIDETYYHYKGIFYKGSLEKNDTIYLKNLLEGNKQDIFLEVENPSEILNRLEEKDFYRFNILNKKVFEKCIDRGYTNRILAISGTVKNNNLVEDLIKIISNLQYENLKKYIEILFNALNEFLLNILDNCKDQTVINNILITIYTLKDTTKDKIYNFNSYIENNENILLKIKPEDEENFYKNIKLANVKFEYINNSNANKNIVEKIEKLNSYKLNLENIEYILCTILDKKISYGYWITTIYKEPSFSYMKKYVQENFKYFIELYINSLDETNKFINLEDEVINILNSSIEDKYKLKYCENNETVITDLRTINNLKSESDILNSLFRNDKIKFTASNIKTYWDIDNEYWGIEFTNFINRNIVKYIDYAEDIFNNNINVCNHLINDEFVSIEIFDIMLEFANEPIDKLSDNLGEDKICKLIEKKFT